MSVTCAAHDVIVFECLDASCGQLAALAGLVVCSTGCLVGWLAALAGWADWQAGLAVWPGLPDWLAGWLAG